MSANVQVLQTPWARSRALAALSADHVTDILGHLVIDSELLPLGVEVLQLSVASDVPAAEERVRRDPRETDTGIAEHHSVQHH